MLRAAALAAAVLLLAPEAIGPPEKHLGFAILEDDDKGEDLTDVAKDFALFRELGVTTWRGSFGWDDYEPARGHYDFEWLRRFADLAAKNGITLWPSIGYTPKWAAAGGRDKDDWNDPPKDLDEWYRFVRALTSAMRRHGNIVSYEIYNEENVGQWWDGSPEAYRTVLSRAADAVHEANPDARVILGGMVYPDVNWLREICAGGNRNRFSILPFHAYPETWTPPGVTVENYLGPAFASGFVRAADAACGRKPMWINETGFATTEGRSERQQAEWWLRAVATFGSEPRVEQIGIYEIKDMKPDRPAIGDTPNYHLGITDVGRRKKMAFGTLARVTSLVGRMPVEIGDATVTLEASAAPDTGSDVYRHVFIRRDGHQIVFVWTKRTGVRMTIHLPQSGSTATEYSVDGMAVGRYAVTGRAMRDVALQPNEVRLFDIAP